MEDKKLLMLSQWSQFHFQPVLPSHLSHYCGTCRTHPEPNHMLWDTMLSTPVSVLAVWSFTHFSVHDHTTICI